MTCLSVDRVLVSLLPITKFIIICLFFYNFYYVFGMFEINNGLLLDLSCLV